MAERKRKAAAASGKRPAAKRKTATSSGSRSKSARTGDGAGGGTGGNGGGRRGGNGKGGGGGRRPAPRPERSRRTRIAITAVRWSLIAGIWGMLIVGGIVAWYAYDLPSIDKLETPTRKASVTLLDADGHEFATYGDVYGRPVRFKDLPPYLVQAVVATEDRRFFEHGGFDPRAVARAMVANVLAGHIRQGGSTLTQQLAKNLFLSPERTLRRKVQELLLAFWLEANFTKQQIFTLYINRVYLGSGTFGIDAAAHRYFGKPASRLTLLESAVVAGLLKAPTRYSPLNDVKAATDRAHVVLDAMVAAGLLDAKSAREAKRQKLQVASGERRENRASHYFADWVMERVYGYVGRGEGDLVVRTTLDPRLQELAANDVSSTLARSGAKAHVGQGALVSMTPDGAVRALVGGRDYGKSQFNRATQALRQPGSSFKLFVYLAALENGLTPDSRFVDGPVKIGNWSPHNYEGTYLGTVTLREALAKSINTVAVEVSEKVGRGKVIDVARRLGITTPIKAQPSLALGVNETTLLEMTAAYGAIPNGGVAVWPYGITEIDDPAGKVLYKRRDGAAPQVLPSDVLARINNMLHAVVAWGTGKAANPGRPAAGKTGTSQDFRDAWFIGYTGSLVTGVWLGNDDGAPMKHVTGGGLPARIWRAYTVPALKGIPPKPLIPAADSWSSSLFGSSDPNEDYNKGD